MEKHPQQSESQKDPEPKDVKISGSDSQEHSQPASQQQTGNTYTQSGGGSHNPQIQGVNQISPNGDFNMGCGATYDGKGDTAK